MHHFQLPNPYMSSYTRNAKGVAVLWAVFTICYAIVAVLVFFQPYWLGSTDRSEQAGVFGLYQYCQYSRSTDVSVENCHGEIADYHHILTPFFKVSTVLLGVSGIAVLLSIVCMLLFLCVQAKHVFSLCACLQLISFLCLLVGCVVYPAGWDHPVVRSVCGQHAGKYAKGACELRWSYILAIVGVFDALFLSVLGFILSSKQIKKVPDAPLRGDLNPTFNHTGMVPFLMHNPRTTSTNSYANGSTVAADRMSQFSATGLQSSNRLQAEYAASVQNFQL